MVRLGAIAAVVAFLGCSAAMKLDALDETLRNYHIHLAAGDVDRASAYVAPEAMESFMEFHDPVKAPRIEEYQVVSVTRDLADPKAKRAFVIIAAQVRRPDSLVIRAVRWKETWDQADGGTWRMSGVEPLARNAPLPRTGETR